MNQIKSKSVKAEFCPEFFSAADIQRQKGISRYTLRRLAREFKLRSLKLGKSQQAPRLYNRGQLESILSDLEVLS